MKVFSPVLTATAFGVLLAGCGQTTVQTTDEAPVVPSSSSEAMMQQSSSADMMMSSSAMSDAAGVPVSTMYKDGTYSADGVYQSPAGGELVHVSVTIKGDMITDATYKGDATNGKSIKFQEAFGLGFKEQVVGKSVDAVSLTVVNGSSLTGKGFMEALSKIKASAKA